MWEILHNIKSIPLVAYRDYAQIGKMFLLSFYLLRVQGYSGTLVVSSDRGSDKHSKVTKQMESAIELL